MDVQTFAERLVDGMVDLLVAEQKATMSTSSGPGGLLDPQQLREAIGSTGLGRAVLRQRDGLTGVSGASGLEPDERRRLLGASRLGRALLEREQRTGGR